MSGIVMAVSAGVSLLAGGIGKIHANNKARQQELKAKQYERDLKAFEASRQAVINQAGDIRNLKKQVNNPYAKLAVATQAADLKIEQTDQALANTLDQINQSGTGSGAATAMARMAAASKAQVGATIETQEVQNQKLRIEGEAAADQRKMALEQAALGAEVAAFDRQENRDIASLDRLAGLQENAEAAAMMQRQQGQEALMGGITGAVGIASSIPGSMEANTNLLGNKTNPPDFDPYTNYTV
tara:strand:- start:999 stop:1724 length:726 start_codon:yes stop_codon:yes gene_type:complete